MLAGHDCPCSNKILEVFLFFEPAHGNHLLLDQRRDGAGRGSDWIEYALDPWAGPFPDRQIPFGQGNHAVIFRQSPFKQSRAQQCVGVKEYAAVLPEELVVTEMVLGHTGTAACSKREHADFETA
ncbi:MAG: hypothetical protein ACI4TJ_04770 [Candidatus Cryptobacteroides sp.]